VASAGAVRCARMSRARAPGQPGGRARRGTCRSRAHKGSAATRRSARATAAHTHFAAGASRRSSASRLAAAASCSCCSLACSACGVWRGASHRVALCCVVKCSVQCAVCRVVCGPTHDCGRPYNCMRHSPCHTPQACGTPDVPPPPPHPHLELLSLPQLLLRLGLLGLRGCGLQHRGGLQAASGGERAAGCAGRCVRACARAHVSMPPCTHLALLNTRARKHQRCARTLGSCARRNLACDCTTCCCTSMRAQYSLPCASVCANMRSACGCVCVCVRVCACVCVRVCFWRGALEAVVSTRAGLMRAQCEGAV
jgi:hypothetical protein